jgi:hypothetical protein
MFSEFNKTNAKALIQTLKRIFLAITHAATYIKTRAFMTTMFDYFELFRENEINQMRVLDKDDLNDVRRNYSLRYEIIAT